MKFIEIESLSKEYNFDKVKNWVLKDINLSIDRGEMIAIMGPSGAGKTTLLNILGCLDKQTSGRYVLDGEDIGRLDKKSLAKIRNQKIGFVFQQFALIPEYTIYENIELPVLYRKNFKGNKQCLNKKQRYKLIEESLRNVGLADCINKKPNQLSGGQQQRVAIARALINDPEIILADEPTGALDQKTGTEIMNLLKSINERGKTIIIVTHDSKVADYCKKTLNVIDGQLIFI